MNHKKNFATLKYIIIALTYKKLGVLPDDFTEILIREEDGHRCPKQYFMNISTISQWKVFKSCRCRHYNMINNIHLLFVVPVFVLVVLLPWHSRHIIKIPINTVLFQLDGNLNKSCRLKLHHNTLKRLILEGITWFLVVRWNIPSGTSSSSSSEIAKFNVSETSVITLNGC